MEVNIHEAKTHLSRILERVRSGEEVIIAKAGKPIAKLVRFDPPRRRTLGAAAGKIVFREGWDAPMSDRELEEFLGESPARYKRLPVVRRGRKVEAVVPRRPDRRRPGQ